MSDLNSDYECNHCGDARAVDVTIELGRVVDEMIADITTRILNKEPIPLVGDVLYQIKCQIDNHKDRLGM